MDMYEEEMQPFATHGIWDVAVLTPQQDQNPFLSQFPTLPQTKPITNPFTIDDLPISIGAAETPFALNLENTEFDVISDNDYSWGTNSFSTVQSEEEPVDNNIWEAALHPNPTPKLQTWETFLDSHFTAPSTTYISESSTHSFDALVQAIELTSNGKARKPILQPSFVEALKEVIRGRGSRLFYYDDASRRFEVRLDDARISGYTSESSQHLFEEICQYTSAARGLTQRVHVFVAPKRQSTTLTSLGSAIIRTMTSMEYLLETLLANVSTAMGFQSYLLRPAQLLALLSETLGSVEKGANEVELMSILWTAAVRLEEHQSWMFPIVAAMHSTVAASWSRSVDAALGLPNTDKSPLDQYPNSVEAVGQAPVWIDEPIRQEMQKILSNIRVLRRHEPGHPLLSSGERKHNLSITPACGAPGFDATLSRAADYQLDMKTAMRSFDTHHDHSYNMLTQLGLSSTDSQGNSNTIYSTAQYTDIEEADDPFPLVRHELEDLVLQTLNGAKQEKCTFTLPISLASSMHCELVTSTQAQLVNQACLRLMFKEHNLKAHLLLQQRFYLLSDGVFASRLAHALFDADIPSTQRKKGHQRIGTAGLRLGQRDSWPPASSELRLALRGILADCCAENDDQPILGSHGELPGNLSFAVRTISENALQRCMDLNNIEALDFLSLQYQAPEPIDAIITDEAVGKYDLIFKQLLRCQRMLHTVKQLCHPRGVRGAKARGYDVYTRRFRIEAQHFVSSICGYFSHRIATEMQYFNAKIEETDHRIEAYSLHEDEDPQSIQDFHETVLDRILFALFLRKRQAQLLLLLEEIFTLILVFAKEEHESVESRGSRHVLQRNLHSKVVKFIRTCNGLVERKDHAPVLDGRMSNGENVLGQLLSVLNMNGYYKL